MASSPAPLDDELRALYRGSLNDFIAGRQALAKQLRRAGDPRAPEVATLRKPSLSAWAVNQLFARETAAMAALVDAGRQARAAQEKGERAPLREALTTIRAEVARLTGMGTVALARGDRVPGDGIVERVQHDLEALALDPGAAEIAARGWLDEDLEPPGFEILAALQVAAAGPSRQGDRSAAASYAAPAAPQATVHSLDDARARRDAEVERRRQRERRERIDRLAADAGRADAEAARQRRAAEEAVRAAERAAEEAAEAARRATAAQGAVAAAEDRARRAEATAAKAREALQAVLGAGD